LCEGREFFDTRLGIPGTGIPLFQIISAAIPDEFPALFPANFRRAQDLAQGRLGLTIKPLVRLRLGKNLETHSPNLFVEA
jgi:hypothetical protein